MPEINKTLEQVFTLCSNKPKGCCPVSHCRKPSRTKGKLCNMHSMRLWRIRNPTRAAFATLRDHAKGRGKEFALTFDHFREICEVTGYADRKGQRPQDLSMDRIDFRKGYVPGNIRVVTVSLNSEKGNRERLIKMSWGMVVWSEIQIEQYLADEKERKDKYDPRKRISERGQDAQFNDDDDDDDDDHLMMAFGSRKTSNEDPF